MIRCFHMRTVGATENEKTSRRVEGWGGTPCFIHTSQWEGMEASMPARGGGEVVKEWKRGASLNRAPAD